MSFKEHYTKVVLIEEGAILDWFKDRENRPTIKKLVNELGMMGLFAVSPPTMAIYVNKFLAQNFPNLGSDIINRIAQYIANNPEILDWFK